MVSRFARRKGKKPDGFANHELSGEHDRSSARDQTLTKGWRTRNVLHVFKGPSEVHQ